VTFQQMLKILWTRKLTIIVSMVVCVIAALAYSKVTTPTFQSSAQVQVSTPSQSGSSTSASLFTLPDPVQELASTAVLNAAAKRLGDPNPQSIAGLVTGVVDPTTGTLTITGTGTTPAGTQAVTQAYTQAFVDQIATVAQAQVDKYTLAIAQTNIKIAALQAQEVPASAANAATANALLNAQITALTGTLTSLQAAQSAITLNSPYAKILVPAFPGGLLSCANSSTTAFGSARTSSRSSTDRCWASCP
jgi:uncharacterized protein involved in exopolysaccharide biosynthesis